MASEYNPRTTISTQHNKQRDERPARREVWIDRYIEFLLFCQYLWFCHCVKIRSQTFCVEGGGGKETRPFRDNQVFFYVANRHGLYSNRHFNSHVLRCSAVHCSCADDMDQCQCHCQCDTTEEEEAFDCVLFFAAAVATCICADRFSRSVLAHSLKAVTTSLQANGLLRFIRKHCNVAAR